MRARPYLLLVPVLAAGLAGAVVAFADHSSDTQFVFRQQHPAQVEPARLAQLVAKAPEPVPARRTRSVAASCVPGGGGQLRNPWTCTVRYRSGSSYRYRVEVQPNGRFSGADRSGQHVIYGCCVETPAAG